MNKKKGKTGYMLSKAIGSMVVAKKRRRKSGASLRAKKGGRGGRFTWLGSGSERLDEAHSGLRDFETILAGRGTLTEAPRRLLRSASCPTRFQKAKYSTLYSLKTLRKGRATSGKSSWPNLAIFGRRKQIHSRKYEVREADGAAEEADAGAPHMLLRLPSDDGWAGELGTMPSKHGSTGDASDYDLWLEVSDSLRRTLQKGVIRPMADLHGGHHFSSEKPSNPKCLRRVYREIRRDLPRGLEVDAFGSTFVRFDGDKPWLMRAVITGAPDTPYADGIFLFDLAATNNYPAGPPNVVHVTPGANTLKLQHSPGGFSPNLHSNSGKVCLSLLGTWDGIGWQANKSNIYQVLSAIGRDILGAEHPYYMEPEFGGWEGTAPTKDHTTEVLRCSEYIREGTLKLAINAPLRSPPAGFEKEVTNHFRAKKGAIEQRVKRWVAEAEVRRAEAEALLRKMREQEEASALDKEGKKKLKELAKDLKWAEGHCERISNLAKETARLLMQVATPDEVQAVLRGAKCNCTFVVKTLERLQQLGKVMSMGNSIREPVVIERGGVKITGDVGLPWQGPHLEWECEANTKLKDANKLKDKIKSVTNKLQSRITSPPAGVSGKSAKASTDRAGAAVAINEEDMASDDEEPYGVSAA